MNTWDLSWTEREKWTYSWSLAKDEGFVLVSTAVAKVCRLQAGSAAVAEVCRFHAGVVAVISESAEYITKSPQDLKNLSQTGIN